MLHELYLYNFLYEIQQEDLFHAKKKKKIIIRKKYTFPFSKNWNNCKIHEYIVAQKNI